MVIQLLLNRSRLSSVHIASALESDFIMATRKDGISSGLDRGSGRAGVAPGTFSEPLLSTDYRNLHIHSLLRLMGNNMSSTLGSFRCEQNTS